MDDLGVDELYRGYRIAIRQTDGFVARITHVRGTLVPLDAYATLQEGPVTCVSRARNLIDRYLVFLTENDLDGEPN
jgi:hypothetical protein